MLCTRTSSLWLRGEERIFSARAAPATQRRAAIIAIAFFMMTSWMPQTVKAWAAFGKGSKSGGRGARVGARTPCRRTLAPGVRRRNRVEFQDDSGLKAAAPSHLQKPVTSLRTRIKNAL